MSNLPHSEQFYQAGEAWASLDAAARLLEECRSAVLAEMMIKHTDLPVSRAEMLVKAGSEWRSYNERAVEARSKANLAKIKLEYERMRFWESQSGAANERMMAKL